MRNEREIEQTAKDILTITGRALLRLGEAADVLRRTPRTVRELVYEGRLSATRRKSRGRMYFRARELARFLVEHEKFSVL